MSLSCVSCVHKAANKEEEDAVRVGGENLKAAERGEQVKEEKETVKGEEEDVKGEKENVKQAQPTGGTGAPVIG